MAKKAETNPPKGTRDFLPADLRRREHVVKVIKEVYESHGFQPLETPTFERLDTLLGKYGDEGDQLVFKVLHRGDNLVAGIRQASAFIAEPTNLVVGRSGETAPGAETLLCDMGLRYDLTVPLARVVAEYQGKLPPVWKRYQIQPVWRADRPGKGRFREFYQCDVDVVGSTSLLVEAEVTGAVAECLVRLGFADFEIRLNHRGLLRAFVEHAKIPLELEGTAIIAVDKLDKVGADGVRTELANKGVSPESAQALLDLVLGDRPLSSLKEALAGHEKGMAAIADLERVLELAQSTSAAAHLRFNATLARGLGYYTGCIFEIAVKDLAGSLGGGGRYDGLIGMFLGKDVPACGFSIGLERILVVMEERGMFPANVGAVDVIVAPGLGEETKALKVAAAIRAEHKTVDLRMGNESPGKIRKHAEETGIGFVITFAGEELVVWSRTEPDVRDRKLTLPEALALLGGPWQ